MRKKPRTIKQLLRELVDHCESCGSQSVNIGVFKVFRGSKDKPKGLLEGLGAMLVPANPKERKRLERQKARENRKGIEVNYSCANCGREFTQFYDEDTIRFFTETLIARYKDQ